MYKDINISYISSYIPRQCGIATFTNDLASSVTKLTGENLSEGRSIQIAAITNNTDGYKYGPEVKFEIKEQSLNDYREAAYFINLSASEIVNLQHEFGLFGGEDGSNILTLIQNLNKPLVTTLHTILADPSDDQLKIIKEIGSYSSHLVALTPRAMKILEKVYKIPKRKIAYIPHGAPDVPFLDPAYYKDKFKLQDRKVILTFGLLGPGKGIEDVLEALPEVVKKYPKITYVVLGATHPNVKKIFGEEYRNKLENLVKANSLEDNVMFINRFVDNKQLLEFLLMSDIYISPNHNKEQIVSGTLTYALASGKAIISTPYWHAEEVLKNDVGILVPFKNPEAIAGALKSLLGDESRRVRLRKNAYNMTRSMIWTKVASNYCDVYTSSIEGYQKVSSLTLIKKKLTGFPALPDVNLNHLLNLTDSTGILQHATYNIPNRNEGYTTDDNARALLVSILNRNIFNDPQSVNLLNLYLSFILHAFNEETGLFRNFMAYDRTWLEESGSEESNANVVFVTGYVIKNPPFDHSLGIAKMIFDRVINNTLLFQSPRAFALILMGCIFYLDRFSGAREVRKVCRTFAEKLSELYKENSTEKWKWFEPIATYNNGRLPQALLMAGKFLKNKEYIFQGLECLNWLYDVQYDKENKHISLIGNNGWLVKGKEKAKYDQQPVEIPALIDACYQAYQITHDKQWITKLGILFSWFLGNNDRHEHLYDYITGGCFDGLSSSVTNKNQGAESTIAWLLSLHRMERIRQDLQIK
jgi:glycosyltransferase involved in cell wall biosynthesis